MMDDIEKTKPVDEAPADDDETGAGCDVCMPPIALVGAEDYDYKYLCMPSMVRALRRNQLQRATRHRRDGGTHWFICAQDRRDVEQAPRGTEICLSK